MCVCMLEWRGLIGRKDLQLLVTCGMCILFNLFERVLEYHWLNLSMERLTYVPYEGSEDKEYVTFWNRLNAILDRVNRILNGLIGDQKKKKIVKQVPLKLKFKVNVSY